MMELLTGLFSFAKESPFKLAIILAIVTSLTGFIIWYDNSRVQAGYNKAKVEIYEQAAKDKAKLEKQYKTELDKLKVKLQSTKQESQENKNKAVALQELLDNRPTVEILREIPKVESDCDSLGADFIRLRNNIIGNAPVIDNK